MYRPNLWATEVRLQAIIAAWFKEQCNGKPHEQTLARRVIESLCIMPDEFFDYIKELENGGKPPKIT